MKKHILEDLTNIVIIPARGGSKGIPRKNLRPVAGFPMIYYSIKAALSAKTVSRVVVSTDDDEIALFAERFGAAVIMRSHELAGDSITLDPVVLDAIRACETLNSEEYDFVVTVQPTSPLVRSVDIDAAVGELFEKELDTVLSVVDDRHLCWTITNGRPVPVYSARVNRQSLPPNFRETGAVIACTRSQLESGSRIGRAVGIYEVPYEYSFDIDTFSDLYVCEALLSRKRVVFTVVGYAEVGLGHAYRAVMFAHELVHCELVFVCEERSDLAIDYIRSNNYDVIIAANGRLADTVAAQNPALVVNDILDTDNSYMEKLADAGIVSINFEDMGPGHKLAALVVNALYPNQGEAQNVLVGPDYFCLRDEFLYLDSCLTDKHAERVEQVLITFGGVDEGNLTAKVLTEIAAKCVAHSIKIEIITGPGYAYSDHLEVLVNQLKLPDCQILRQTKRISEHMSRADVAITSAGRTVLELAAMSVPMIVICQNERETTHSFANSDNGIINLGHRLELEEGVVVREFDRLILDAELRKRMIDKMETLDLKNGKSRVIDLIKSFIK